MVGRQRYRRGTIFNGFTLPYIFNPLTLHPHTLKETSLFDYHPYQTAYNMLKPYLFNLLLLLTLQLYSLTKLPLTFSPYAFALSLDLSTLVINPYSSLVPGLHFYRNNGSAFSPRGRTPRDYPPSTTPQQTPQLNSDGSILVSSYSDNTVRVYHLAQETSELLQKIDVGYPTTESFLSTDGTLLVVASQTPTTPSSVYQWDTRKRTFLFLSNLTMGTVKAVSPDGRYIIDLNSQSSPSYPYTTTTQPFLSYLSPLTRTQYVREQLTLPQQSPTPTYLHFSLAKRNDTTYPLLALLQSPTPTPTYTLQYLLMQDGKITAQQTIATLPEQPSALSLSANGNVLAYGFDSQLFVYVYSPALARFALSSQHPQLPTRSNPNCLFLSNSAHFLAASSHSPLAHPDDPYALSFFTNCTPPCRHCWPNHCLACSPTFTLVGDTCLCPPGTHPVADTCKVCPVPHCSRCASATHCEVCSEGFQLSEGQCFCGEASSVSLASGYCVRCEIEGCSHCEMTNICADKVNIPADEGETDAQKAERSELSQHTDLSHLDPSPSENPIKQAAIEMLQTADDQDAVLGTLVLSLLLFLLKICCTCVKDRCMRCFGFKKEDQEKKEKEETGTAVRGKDEDGKTPYVEFSDEKGEELQSETKIGKVGKKNKPKRLEDDETEH